MTRLFPPALLLAIVGRLLRLLEITLRVVGLDAEAFSRRIAAFGASAAC